MEKPNAQPCILNTSLRDEKTPVEWQPTGMHKRARSRHLRTASTDVSGVRIRGAEPWAGSWNVGGTGQVMEDAQGIALPDFPVVGGEAELTVDIPTWGMEQHLRKTELTLDIPSHTNVSIPSVAIVPSTPSSTSPSKAFTFPPLPAEEEEGRLRGFTFGRPSAADPPSTEIPVNPTRKKRHSHTRSTSISTRASILPSSPTLPDESSTTATTATTMDERRKTLSTLEGRMGQGEAWAGKDTARAGRRRSRVSGVDRVEIALPVMDDSEDEVSGSLACRTRKALKCRFQGCYRGDTDGPRRIPHPALDEPESDLTDADSLHISPFDAARTRPSPHRPRRRSSPGRIHEHGITSDSPRHALGRGRRARARTCADARAWGRGNGVAAFSGEYIGQDPAVEACVNVFDPDGRGVRCVRRERRQGWRLDRVAQVVEL